MSFTETLTLQDTSQDDLTTETVDPQWISSVGIQPPPRASCDFFFDPDGTAAGSQNSGSDVEDLVEVQGTGNAQLRGLGGNDRLVGHAGDDRLDGGAGDDTLTQAIRTVMMCSALAPVLGREHYHRLWHRHEPA